MEEDLYDIALEETEKEKSVEPEEQQGEKVVDDVPKDMEKYAMYVRKLVIGARKSIQRLENENKELKENLKNSLNSSSVVTCPDCTHSFKERHHSIRPNHMKAFRANKCVELEFKSVEDMTTWLYLNQLETNSDGMPTVMKTESKQEQLNTLKSVGSKLPELNYRNKHKEDQNRKRRLESAKDEKEDAEKRIRIGIKKTEHVGKESAPSTSSSSSSIRPRSEREKVELERMVNLDEKRNHIASNSSVKSRGLSKSESRRSRDSDDRKKQEKHSSHSSRDEKQERRSQNEKHRRSSERSHHDDSRKRETERRKERSPKSELSRSGHLQKPLEIKPIAREIDKKFSTWTSAKPKSPTRSPTPSSSSSSSRSCRKPITFASDDIEKNDTEPKKNSILSRISFTSKSAVRKLNIGHEEKQIFKTSPAKLEQQFELQTNAPAPAIKTNFKVPTKKTNEHVKKEEVIPKVVGNPVPSTAKFTMSREKRLIKKESEQAVNESMNSSVSAISSNQSTGNGTVNEEMVGHLVRDNVDQAESEQHNSSNTSSESSFVLPVEPVKKAEYNQNASQFLQHCVTNLQQKDFVPNSPNLLSEFFPDFGKCQNTAPTIEKKVEQEIEEEDDMSYWASGDAVESEDGSDQEMEYEKREEENVYPEASAQSRRSSMSSLTSDGKSEQDEVFSDCSISQDANPRTPKMKTPEIVLDEIEVLDWDYDEDELGQGYYAGNISDDQIPITPNNGAVIQPQDLKFDDSGEVEDGECSSEEEMEEEEEEEKEENETDEFVHRRSISPTQKENKQKPKEITNKNRGKRRNERMAESYSNGIPTDQRAFGIRRN